MEHPPAHLTVGLTNLGNTCYANAAVQCVAHCPALVRALLLWQGPPAAMVGTPLADAAVAMRRLVAEMWLQRSPDPAAFTAAAQKLLGGGGGQQDASELLVLVLGGLQDKLSNSGDSARFKSTLETVLLRGIRCGACRARVVHRETSQVLFAQLSQHQSEQEQLQDCIERSMAHERIEGWRCDECGKVSGINGIAPAIKRARLVAPLPEVLVVPISRGALGITKDIRPVACPNQLELSTDKGDTMVYVLQALLCHSGSGVHGGHYYALCLHPETGDWLCYNDKCVTKVQDPATGSGVSRDVYVSFYSACRR